MRKRKWVSETAWSVCVESGTSDAVQGAVVLAERFTTECGVTYASRHLDVLASGLDAKIQRCAMRDAGQLVPPLEEGSPSLILVNEAHSRQRQNFSICHEMGHLLMPNYNPFGGGRRDMETMRWNPEEEEEFLCDVAAAEILLPRRVFKPRLRGCGLCIEALHELAEEFDTSLEATALGIVRANLDDIAVVVWEPGYNKKEAASAATLSLFADVDDPQLTPVEKKFRVKFGVGTGKLSDAFFPPHKSVPNDSLIAQAARQLADGESSQTRGMQHLMCDGSEREFYVESQAYPTVKDGQPTAKVLSLVFLRAPTQE